MLSEYQEHNWQPALLRRAYAGLEDGVGQFRRTATIPGTGNSWLRKGMRHEEYRQPRFLCGHALWHAEHEPHRIFQQVEGARPAMPRLTIIRSMRLQYAAQLLREKDCSITEISDDSGFSDVRYFREVFRKYYGMSPSEYRNSMRG